MDDFVTRKCPKCKKRVLDSTSDSSGKVRLKCMHCKQLVTIDLAAEECEENTDEDIPSERFVRTPVLGIICA